MSQPDYIKGLPRKEYHRQYRLAHPNIGDTSRREYMRLAVAKHRANDVDKARLQSRFYRMSRRARLRNARTQGYIMKEKIHNWDSRLCGICDEYINDEYQIDHIIPLIQGGPHCTDNLQLAHPLCNRIKGGAIMELRGADRASPQNGERGLSK